MVRGETPRRVLPWSRRNKGVLRSLLESRFPNADSDNFRPYAMTTCGYTASINVRSLGYAFLIDKLTSLTNLGT